MICLSTIVHVFFSISENEKFTDFTEQRMKFFND